MVSDDGCSIPFAPSREVLLLIPVFMAVVIIALEVILTRVFTKYWTGFKLNEECIRRGETRETFTRQAAINTVGFLIHGFIGPYSFYYTLQFLHVDPRDDIVKALEVVGDPGHCHRCTMGVWAGLLFGAQCVSQFFGLFLGWEKGFDAWFHHTLFSALTYFMLFVYSLPMLSLAAMAMEISSPVLLVFMIFQRLEGEGAARIVSTAKPFFAFLFFLGRVLLFGYVVVRYMYYLVIDSERFLEVEHSGIKISAVVLYFMGWLLQLYWFRLIVSKALGSGKRKQA